MVSQASFVLVYIGHLINVSLGLQVKKAGEINRQPLMVNNFLEGL